MLGSAPGVVINRMGCSTADGIEAVLQEPPYSVSNTVSAMLKEGGSTECTPNSWHTMCPAAVKNLQDTPAGWVRKTQSARYFGRVGEENTIGKIFRQGG